MKELAILIFSIGGSIAVLGLAYMAFAFGYSLYIESKIDYDNYQKYKNYWKDHHFEKEDC